MDHLPIFVRVRDRESVVVGGGAVAARKAELLLRCGARVTLVAPQLGPQAAELVAGAHGRVRHLAAAFDPLQLDGAALVIAATDSAWTNESVAAAANARGLPVNVADDPELSSFILPAVVDRSPVIVAIGTHGAAPVLARRVREQIEALLPHRLGALARFAGSRRGAVRRQLPASARRPFWERVFGGPVSAQVLAGDESAADAAFTRELATFREAGRPLGEVYLIGAGPGDPDLLTLRALQLMQQADVILYDRLVSEEVLDRARREAERIFVGKTAGATGDATQERIYELMVSRATAGARVARLKGGDPFIFGRGGEEIRVLARHGIPFTVVPGITAGLGAAAAAAIPLTQRDLAQSVTFAAGHLAAGDGLDWQALARPRHTVVFYMGVTQMEHIVNELTAAGAPRERPAAIVERATLPGERVLRGTLADIASLARAEHISAPALLIVGDAAAAGRGSVTVESLTETLRGVA
jgi:uroporphyrin-III C-methyltransferase / precorrin-2 dehydrogenase / sirohydrochlorin ferrochelatase